MKGVYLCARKHRIPGYNIVYNDIIEYPGIDLCVDALQIDFEKFDFIIATPPCNYWSRANWRRECSDVALSTKHLLPSILFKCIDSKKPFIVENVMNKTLFDANGLLSFYVFTFGGHTFWTNVFMFIPDKSYAVRQNKQYVSREKRDNNQNVDLIIKLFLETIHQVES